MADSSPSLSEPGAAPAKVAVLLATKNGAAFLDEQLRSLAGQTWPAIDVWASDDGSTDATVAILSQWRERWSRGAFTLLDGPRAGFAENFRFLLACDAGNADYVAFCDQDDLWEREKLSRAIGWMRSQDAAVPLLFCSRTYTVTERGDVVGMSPLFRRKPSFRNALVQSLAGGNTMVMNRPASRLLARAARRSPFVSHDWLAYQIVTGAGGVVRYCKEPLVRYRQHGGNVVGANTSMEARLARLKLLLDGRFKRWTDANLASLGCNRDLLTPDALAALDEFAEARQGNMLGAMARLRRSGVYRQTLQGTLGLWGAALFRLL
ncbi:glycosyltransferase family 2 protein [Mesorhizobium sp. ZMM04-5]|uniref:Glycosyltransferase family 2 protein n=1 Tax=Mesorhizobium marinum TaxID=3228790 RepID=A0ABV3R290_9HYPH